MLLFTCQRIARLREGIGLHTIILFLLSAGCATGPALEVASLQFVERDPGRVVPSQGVAVSERGVRIPYAIEVDEQGNPIGYRYQRTGFDLLEEGDGVPLFVHGVELDGSGRYAHFDELTISGAWVLVRPKKIDRGSDHLTLTLEETLYLMHVPAGQRQSVDELRFATRDRDYVVDGPQLVRIRVTPYDAHGYVVAFRDKIASSEAAAMVPAKEIAHFLSSATDLRWQSFDNSRSMSEASRQTHGFAERYLSNVPSGIWRFCGVQTAMIYLSPNDELLSQVFASSDRPAGCTVVEFDSRPEAVIVVAMP